MSQTLTDKTLTPLRNDYFVVQVQPNSMTHQLWGSVLVDEVKYLTMPSPGRFKNHTVKIPPGSYTIVGLLKDLTIDDRINILQGTDHTMNTLFASLSLTPETSLIIKLNK